MEVMSDIVVQIFASLMTCLCYFSVADENSARSVAMVYSLTTVLKEWGVQKGNMDRQMSFALRDKDNQRSFKGFISGKMSSKSKKVGK